jgi:hypothetical protein
MFKGFVELHQEAYERVLHAVGTPAFEDEARAYRETYEANWNEQGTARARWLAARLAFHASKQGTPEFHQAYNEMWDSHMALLREAIPYLNAA